MSWIGPGRFGRSVSQVVLHSDYTGCFALHFIVSSLPVEHVSDVDLEGQKENEKVRKKMRREGEREEGREEISEEKGVDVLHVIRTILQIN